MRPRLYHNPRCSKSRGTLELLRERGVEPEIVPYLEQPLDAHRLAELHRKLGGDVRAMIRDGEPEFTELGLDDPTLSDQQLLAAVAKHPRLLQRPILEVGERAAIGRPPEAVLDILP